MQTTATVTIRDRLRASTAVAIIHIVLGLALVRGLDAGHGTRPTTPSEAIRIFDLSLPTPICVGCDQLEGDKGASAPPDLEARPKPIAAPDPQVRVPTPPLIEVPPVAADGPAPTSGASPTPGPGTGADGTGQGTGSGASGTGPGAGGAGPGPGPGQPTRARLLTGSITRRDYPRDAWAPGTERAVTVRFHVDATGRPNRCEVLHSSGSPDVDATTCRLVLQRFRYEPARDREGRAAPDEQGWRQTLWTER